VDADLDTLATALYARTDDLLKRHPERVPERPAVAIAPKISDAEVVTLAVLQALLGCTSEARWVRFADDHLRHLFPYQPKQPGYNKRLRRLAATLNWLIGTLARDTSVWTDDVWIVDSTPVECARSRDTVRRSDLAGWAEYGYCASHSRYFWGLRLALTTAIWHNDHTGQPVRRSMLAYDHSPPWNRSPRRDCSLRPPALPCERAQVPSIMEWSQTGTLPVVTDELRSR